MKLEVYGREEPYILPIVEPEEVEYLYRRETYEGYEYCYSYKEGLYYSDLKHMFEEYPGTELTTYEIREEESGDTTVIVPNLHFLDTKKIEVLSYYQKYGSTPLLVMRVDDKLVFLTGSEYQHVTGYGKPVIIGYRYYDDEVVLLPLLESQIFTSIEEIFIYSSRHLCMYPLGELTDIEKEEFAFSTTGLSALKDITEVLEVALSECDEHIKSGYKQLSKMVSAHIEHCELVRHSEDEELETGLDSFRDISSEMIDKYIMLEKKIKDLMEEHAL